MTNYIIRPGTNYSPNSEIFTEMSKKELKEFYQWFMTSLPYCIEELMQLVANTPGFEKWEADDSPNSLDGLCAWFATQVKTRDLTPDEIEFVKSKLTSPIEIDTCTLTEETKSFALYVGMYYGEVMLKNNPLLKWKQLLGDKRYADYGQPVVSGGRAVPINPVRVAHSIAYGLADGTDDGHTLRNAYEYWAELVRKRMG